jgi:pyrroline-5-carboxylate reductase
MPNTIGFIGGGRITAIFLRAWKRQGLEMDRVVVSDQDASILARLQVEFPTIEITPNNQGPAGQDIVFLALHPPVMKSLLPEVAQTLRPESTVVSLAPVLTFSKISALLSGHTRLVRMIPNAPSLIGKGFNPVAFGPGSISEDRQRLRAYFAALGQAPEVEEDRLEAYAILIAMGPTYFWPQWQTLRELGRSFGLEQEATDTGLAAMLHGAVDLLFQSGMTYEEVMDTIPVKPLAEAREVMLEPYATTLPRLHDRLTGR